MSIFLNLRTDGSMALFIDGDLQFDERDEHIYHDGLANPALQLASGRLSAGGTIKALIVGGGDGLTARELLKSSSVTTIDLVDYSAEVLDLAVKQLAHLNQMSLADHRVSVHTQDAWQFVKDGIKQKSHYDLIVVDLTVAKDAGGAKFHSIEWYGLLARLLSDQGILAANCVSPTNTPHAYWSVFNSMRAAGLAGLPYRVTIPSFSQLGYGPDWGFMLASKTKIECTEFDRLSLNATQMIKLKSLFAFPGAFAELQKQSQPGEKGSNIFLHYLLNDEPYCTTSKESWQPLQADLEALPVPTSDSGKAILPKDVRHRLADKTAAIFPGGGQELLDQVLALMPALQASHTRLMMAEFISNPASFLEALDIKALVNKLVKRAAELPLHIASELKLLQEKLVDWAGDYETLLDLGRRVVTTLAVVVILANFVFPDSAYGKGEHGGGHFTNRGGGHRMANGGWNHGWGHDRGRYGGWGRPNHWNRWGYGGWGGYGSWGPTYYASGPAYLSTNYSNGQAPDSQGNQYPVNSYNCVHTYGVVPDQPWVAPAGSNGSGAASQTGGDAAAASTNVSANILKTAYRLGPDVDVLAGGGTVVPLTDNGYLRIGPGTTDLIDQQSGQSLITLYTDPSLIWHIASELKHQSSGLKKAAAAKDIAGGGETSEDSDLPAEVLQTGSPATTSGSGDAPASADDATNNVSGDASNTLRDEAEVKNMVTTAKLLDKAEQTLGTVSERPPEAGKAPVEGAFELFNSAWATPDGKYVILKKGDGALVYVDGQNWYSDAGTTKIDAPYPAKLKPIITSYLSSLAKDAASSKDSLTQEQTEIQTHLDKLKAHLVKLKAGPSTDAASSTATKAASSTAAAGTGQAAGQDIVQFGTKKIPRAEAIKRMEGLIARAQKHLDSVQNEINNLPTETEAVNKLLTKFQA